MKPEEQIERRLNILKRNMEMIKNQEGKARMQNYINALKWVLSEKDDKADEVNRLIS